MSLKLVQTAACLVAATTAASAQSLVLEKHTIHDSAAVNRDAVTFLKPRGWRVEGGIRWYPDLAHQASLEMRLFNPDGPEQIEALPSVTCCWFTNPVMPLQPGQIYMGNIVLEPIDHPRDVLRRLTLPQLRRQYNPRITETRELPEVARALSATMGGAPVRSARIRVEYDLAGQAVEEDFYVSLYWNSVDLGVNNSRSIIWGAAWPPFALRAAKGKLDAMTPLLMSVVNSGRMNPRWFAEVQFVCHLFNERMRGAIIDARKISDHIRRNNDEIARMYSDAYWQRSAIQDRTAQQFSNYIRGVERFESPYERYPVQLPAGYRHAWANADGSYLMSNEAGFDPNVGSTTEWRLLKQVD